MLQHFFKLLLLSLLISSPFRLSSQVTIGTNETPAFGALLQLKNKTNVDDGSENATRGLGMPRVDLLNIRLDDTFTDLSQTIVGASGVWDKDEHIGLFVYNMADDYKEICPGLFVWLGESWQKLGAPCQPFGVEVSPASVSFASGQPLQSINPTTLTVSWTRPLSEVAWTNAPSDANSSWGAVGINANSFNPTLPWTTDEQQQTVILTPDAMPSSDILDDGTGNPFRTRESKLTFTATNNGVTVSKDIQVLQTNKAITINDKLLPSVINDPTAGVATNSITLKSNTKWKLKEVFPVDNTAALSNITVTENGVARVLEPNVTVIDWDRNDNAATGNTGNISYTISTGASHAYENYLVFTDAEEPKRYDDIKVTIKHCSNVGTNPTLSEWAARAGFEGVAETKTSDVDDIVKKINTPNATTGIAWHRDQSGNIFLSASFAPSDVTGNSERWMITNLAAQRYSPNVTHSASRALTGPKLPEKINTASYWTYPTSEQNSTSSANYQNNPRLGLLYTWDAATAGKGGSDGISNADGGTYPYQEGSLVEWNGTGTRPNGTQKRRQGICPDGWHLPSDREFTLLEIALATNKTLFSSATSNGVATEVTNSLNPTLPETVNVEWRGLPSNVNGHGNVAKQICEPSANASAMGIGNPISTEKRPSFNAIFAGYSSKDSNGSSVLGYYAYLWTSSQHSVNTVTASNAIARSFKYDGSQVWRTIQAKDFMMSVRCKKDN